jgi:hypothetical protein
MLKSLIKVNFKRKIPWLSKHFSHSLKRVFEELPLLLLLRPSTSSCSSLAMSLANILHHLSSSFVPMFLRLNSHDRKEPVSDIKDKHFVSNNNKKW